MARSEHIANLQLVESSETQKQIDRMIAAHIAGLKAQRNAETVTARMNRIAAEKAKRGFFARLFGL